MLKNKGFTLIELLVVVMIVIILASVAIPLMRGNLYRARLTEGIAGLGQVRTQMRLYEAEHGGYPDLSDGAVIGTGRVSGFSAGDLDGRYFEDNDYTIASNSTTGYYVTVAGDTAGDAPKGSEVDGIGAYMDQDGQITEDLTPN